MSSHRIFPYPFWTIPEPLVPDIIPVYFISFLRLATEQHSTLLQKVGINGKVYLLNKMNNFTSSRPTLWLKSSRNCSGGWRGLVGGFSYYIKIFYQIYFIKIYIWKRGKPKSAKHRRILMPIWFHSLTILPGSAAGAAGLKSGDAVRWWLLSIALATRGRAGAADPPLKSFSLLGFSRFWGSGWEKRG